MNKWLKIMCLVLVLAFVLPALVACDKDKDNDKGSEGGKTDGVVITPPSSISEDANYNGDTFTMYSVEDMFAKKYFFADKTTGDGMNDAIYQRQQNVESVLNVDLVWKPAEGSGATPAFQTYATEVKNSIKAGDAKYQLVLTHAYYAIPDLITGNSLKDLKELQSLSVNEDYWNKDIMDQLSYKDHYYLGYSDFNLAQTYVVAFNKSIFNNFSTSLDGYTMYDFVNNGEWTLETMSEVATLAFVDNGSESTNIYGLTGELWVPFCGFIQSSGESIVARDAQSGLYSVTWIDNKTIKNKMNNVVNAIRDIGDLQETYFWKHEAFQANPTMVLLQDGKAFMQLMGTNALIDLKNTQVKFGVLPYPMYDKDQYSTVKYRSLNWAGYLCVPSNNLDNADMVGDVIECLSYFSDNVTTYYYEKLLGLKVSEAPEDAKMLEIIWGSLCSDFGVVYEGLDGDGGTKVNNIDCLVYTVPRCVMEDLQFASWNSRYGGAANNVIKKALN